MQTTEAKERLNEMLADAGFDPQFPDIQLLWQVWKSFVQEPVDCADDGILFECGTYDFTGAEVFSWGFVRQFTVDVEDEYDHMEQLSCKCKCAPTEQLRSSTQNMWAYDFSTLEEYFVAVEELDGFCVPLRFSHNWKCEIEQHKV